MLLLEDFSLPKARQIPKPEVSTLLDELYTQVSFTSQQQVSRYIDKSKCFYGFRVVFEGIITL